MIHDMHSSVFCRSSKQGSCGDICLDRGGKESLTTGILKPKQPETHLLFIITVAAFLNQRSDKNTRACLNPPLPACLRVNGINALVEC